MTIEGFNLEGAEIKAATFDKCIALKRLTKEEVTVSVIDNFCPGLYSGFVIYHFNENCFFIALTPEYI